MKTTDIDLDFRPTSYWDADGLLTAAVANIKGAVRKKEALKLLRAGSLEDLQEFLLEESLSDRTRKLIRSMHPMFMGGEYLPDCLPGEVEIARVTLASVTRDVEVVRARPEAGRIRYRAVDEYYDQYDTTIKIEIEESESPLTMRQLIHVMDTASYYGE